MQQGAWDGMVVVNYADVVHEADLAMWQEHQKLDADLHQFRDSKKVVWSKFSLVRALTHGLTCRSWETVDYDGPRADLEGRVGT